MIPKANSIAEFCMTPILDKKMNITRLEEKQLQQIIARCKEIVEHLRSIKDFGEVEFDN